MAKASTEKVLAFGRICTSGQSVWKLVGAPLVVSLGLLQSGIVEYLVKLDHHLFNVGRLKAARLPALCSGPPPFRCGEIIFPSLITKTFLHQFQVGKQKKSKSFFMRSRPRLIDWRTDSSCTPSASAIALMLMPRMM